MKNFVTIFMVLTIIANVSWSKKLRLINGLNGGLVTGVNGVNPLLVGGLNPPVLSGGAAVLGQPPIPQFVPAAAFPPYVLQNPPVAPVPFGLPNAGALPYPFPPSNGGLPYFFGGAPNQPVVIPPQQQVAAGQVPAGNNQAVGLPGLLTRFKRSFLRRTTARPPVSVTQMPAQLSPTVSGNTVGHFEKISSTTSNF